MTIEEALQIIDESGEYVGWKNRLPNPGETVCLDGNFDSKTLEAVIFVMNYVLANPAE